MRLWFLALLGIPTALAQNYTRVTPGQLLVATERLSDPDFAHSVVLVVASSNAGVQGIWVNRPTTVPLSDLIPLTDSKAPVFQGGPLRLGINALVRSDKQPESGTRLITGVWVVAAPSELPKLFSLPANAWRVFIGSCGWSEPQLDDEINRRGAWTIRNASASIVFDPDPTTLWTRLTGASVAESAQPHALGSGIASTVHHAVHMKPGANH